MSVNIEQNHPYVLNVDEFQASLPRQMTPTLYLECESMEEIAVKINAIIGRGYSSVETQENWFIDGVENLWIDKVAEWLVGDPGSTNPPALQQIYHVLLIPHYAKYDVDLDARAEEDK